MQHESSDPNPYYFISKIREKNLGRLRNSSKKLENRKALNFQTITANTHEASKGGNTAQYKYDKTQ